MQACKDSFARLFLMCRRSRLIFSELPYRLCFMEDSTPLESIETGPASTVTGRDWKTVSKRLLALIFAVAITVGLYLLRGSIEEYSIYGYPGVFLISILGNATLIFPAPSFAIVLVLAGTLHPVWMGIAAGCGAAVGEMTGYLAGFSGRGIIENQPIYERLEPPMRKYGAWLIFLLALIPNPLFDVGGIMAGMLKIPWWKFLVAAAMGKSIRFIILAIFGETIMALGKPVFQQLQILLGFSA